MMCCFAELFILYLQIITECVLAMFSSRKGMSVATALGLGLLTGVSTLLAQGVFVARLSLGWFFYVTGLLAINCAITVANLVWQVLSLMGLGGGFVPIFPFGGGLDILKHSYLL
jgi:hypothetical protein